MRMNSAYLLGLFLFLSGSPTAIRSPMPLAFHGIHVQISARDGVHLARAFYEGGTPVVNGDVTITTPGSEEAWQTGRTDPSGRFAFLPDAPGTWTIQVDDGRGHRTRTTFQVEPGVGAPGPEGESATRADERPTHIHEHGEEEAEGHEHGEEGTGAHEHGEEATEAHGDVREGELSSPEHDAPPVALTPSHSESGQGEARLWQLLTGLGLIAGITGAAYGYTARRKGTDAG